MINLITIKKYMHCLFFLLSFAILISGCSNYTKTHPDPNMILNVNLTTFESIEDDQYIQNPWSYITFGTNQIFRNLFITNAGTGEIDMDLAESYTISDDGLIYEILLKDDVVWSDNEVLDLEDVVFSIENCHTVDLVQTLFLTTFAEIKGTTEFIENPNEVEHIDGLQVNGNTLTITLIYFFIISKIKLLCIIF